MSGQKVVDKERGKEQGSHNDDFCLELEYRLNSYSRDMKTPSLKTHQTVPRMKKTVLNLNLRPHV